MMKPAVTMILLAAAAGIAAGCAGSSAPVFNADVKTIAPYSPSVRAGTTLYVSGQLGLDLQTLELVGEDIESQTKQVFANLQSVLANSGYTLDDVVQCTVYLKDIREFKKMNDLYASYFRAGKYPARVALEVANLPKNGRIEISAIAVK
ncbi:MAG TPA: Rid family detoxifying hydrolase [Bacteroidota bacterium]|nr:Rid family detoxifying hydrolase [Bacteroidota bacterium]